MKRIGNLYDKIISLDNLHLADQKARRGKGRTYGVRVHDKNREENILKLHELLKSKSSELHRMKLLQSTNPKNG